MSKLNLGCGNKIMAGYINVDKFGNPDLNFDLETFPWPWEDNSCEEVVLNHVLEHLGESREIYLNILKELYRVTSNNGEIHIRVPHPNHIDFLTDPTHVRAITPESFQLFSKKLNKEWQEKGYANSPLGLFYNIDFEIISSTVTLDDSWQRKLNNKEVDVATVQEAILSHNNVVKETYTVIKVIK